MSALPGLGTRLKSTVFFEFVVAVTGALLVLFILAHLAGNSLLLLGHEAFNTYAERLQNLGELLWVVRIGMVTIFVSHIACAIHLATLNRTKRAQRYEVHRYVSRRTLASRSMLYSGITLFLFLLLHISNFTLGDKEGPGTIILGMNENLTLGLYGLVWNTFSNPVYALIYIVAMTALGFHLSHAISSVFVTLGVLSEAMTRKVEMGARILGAAVALGFSFIPVWVMIWTYVIGVSSHA